MGSIASTKKFLLQPAMLLSIALAAAPVILQEIRRFQDSTRVITIDVVEQLPLSREANSVSKSLKLTFGDTPVEKPYVSRIRIRNDGSSAIAKDDFDGPLKLTLSLPTVALTAETEERSPDDLGVSMTTSARSVVIDPLLLNSGDEFTIGILSSGGKPNIVGSSRIKNAKPMTRSNEAQERQLVEIKMRSVSLIFSAALACCIVFGMAVQFATYCFRKNYTLWSTALLVATACFFVLLAVQEPFRIVLTKFIPLGSHAYLAAAIHAAIFVLLSTFGTSNARKVIAIIESDGIRYPVSPT